MDNPQPHYTIHLDSSGVFFDVEINGVLFFTFKNMGSIKVDMPINEWLIKGENIIKVTIKPRTGNLHFNDEEGIIVSACIKDAQNLEKEKTVLAQTRTPESWNGEFIDTFSTNLMFTAKIPFDNLLLYKTPPFYPEIKTTVTQIRTYYQQIWDVLESKKIEKLMEMVKFRNKALSSAFYEDYLLFEEGIRFKFNALFNDSNFQIWPLDFEKTQIDFHAKNTIASLRLQNGKSAIAFVNREERITNYLPFYCANTTTEKDLFIIR